MKTSTSEETNSIAVHAGGLIHSFLFKPEEPGFMPVIRIGVGILACLKFAALQPDLSFFLAENGVLPLAQAMKAAPWVGWHWYAMAPVGATTWELLNATAFCASLLGLVLGVFFRPLAFFTFVWMGVLQGRNELVWNSADRLLMLFVFFLLFSEADRGMSWFGNRRVTRESRIAPIARRMIQLQMTIVYTATALTKSQGALWRSGEAVFPVLQLQEFVNNPIGPLRHSLLFSKIASWGTLVIEWAAGTLIWIPALRLPVYVASVLFHLGLNYALNIPVFQWLMILGLTSYLDPRLADEWSRVIRNGLSRLLPRTHERRASRAAAQTS